MSPPTVVIFDLGKVLVDFDYSKAGHAIAARGTAIAEEVRKFIDHTPLLFKYEAGGMTTAEFFGEVRSATGFEGTLPEFASVFADIFVPMEEMIRLHDDLRKKGIPTFILSNTNELAIGHIRRNFPFFANFEGYVFSYETGAMKPDEKIYLAAEELTGKRGGELLFIDDRPENIAAAAKRGWQVILQESPAKTRDALQQFGML